MSKHDEYLTNSYVLVGRPICKKFKIILLPIIPRFDFGHQVAQVSNSYLKQNELNFLLLCISLFMV